MAEQTAYDFTLTSLQGEPLDLKPFRGQPLLIVNTASKCGFTPQYEGLQALWSSHRARGLMIVGVPSNDFGRQEPGTGHEIAEFCARNYGVGFPMTEKLHVRGPDAHPLFGWLGRQGGMLSKPRWNFFKYVIGRDGRLSNWFSSMTTPDSTRFRTAIDRVVLDR
jgi:glutathione peroxidase